MHERDHLLGLPLIRNEKTVDPRDSSSTRVYQLETAMGSAIAVFEGAGAVRVPRTRFTPVKTTDDLLAVRSDAYILTDSFRIISNPARGGDLVVELDRCCYRLIDSLEERFPYGPPSLIACEQFGVSGDVKFGRGVAAKGRVRVINRSAKQAVVEDGSCLSGELVFDG